MSTLAGPAAGIEAEARRQKTALLYRNAGIAQSVNVINAILLAWVNVSNHAPAKPAFAWCCVVVALAALRYGLARRFRAAGPDAVASTAWRRRYLGGTILMGAAWGGGTLLFMWNAPDGPRMFTGLVLSGMVAGSVPLLAPVPAAFAAFAGLVALPMSAVMFLQAQSALHWAFGAMSLVFLAAVVAGAHYLHDILDTSIRLGLEQAGLARELEQARAAAEAALADRERLEGWQRLLMAAVEQSNASIVVTDAAGLIIFANSAFTQTTGYALEEAKGRNPRFLKSGKTPAETYRDLWATVASGRAWHDELCNKKKNGELYWEAASISPIVDAEGRVSHYLAVMDDITQRKQAETEIARLSQWNELLLNSAGEGIFGVDREGHCTFINPAALALLGLEKEEVLGTKAHQLFHHHRPDGSIYPEEECPVCLTRQDGILRKVEETFFRKSGEPFPVQLTVTPMHEGDRLVGAEGVFQDIAIRKAMEQDLVRLAATDPLTGVANRRRFLEQMEVELARFHRFHDQAAFLMVDIDHFKKVNDSFGHTAGDAVLMHLAELSAAHLRRVDLFGRLGGEEFGILLPGTDPDGALQLAEGYLRQVAATPLPTSRGSIPFTVSIGLTCFGPEDTATDSILDRADRALYQAKEGGRNRVVRG